MHQLVQQTKGINILTQPLAKYMSINLEHGFQPETSRGHKVLKATKVRKVKLAKKEPLVIKEPQETRDKRE